MLDWICFTFTCEIILCFNFLILSEGILVLMTLDIIIVYRHWLITPYASRCWSLNCFSRGLDFINILFRTTDFIFSFLFLYLLVFILLSKVIILRISPIAVAVNSGWNHTISLSGSKLLRWRWYWYWSLPKLLTHNEREHETACHAHPSRYLWLWIALTELCAYEWKDTFRSTCIMKMCKGHLTMIMVAE